MTQPQPPNIIKWTQPPTGNRIVIFSPGDRNWLVLDLQEKNLAFDLIWQILNQISSKINGSDVDTRLESMANTLNKVATAIGSSDVDSRLDVIETSLNAIQTEMSVLTADLESLLSGLAQGTRLLVLVNGQRSTGLNTLVPDTDFPSSVSAVDISGRHVLDNGPFSWRVEPASAATIEPDPDFPGDSAHKIVNVTKPDTHGSQASFTIIVTDGSLDGASGQCTPVPGVATGLHVGLSKR